MRLLSRRAIQSAAALLLLGLIGAGCGSSTEANSVIYGLEAENDGGWCLPAATLALSGMQVASAIYDPLTIPDDDGRFVPWLAESIEADADYLTWSIKLREGVTFHDGSPLDATVVKNNIDAFRGTYVKADGMPGPSNILLVIVYSNIVDVVVDDEASLTVTMNSPWPSFPAFLNANNRFGIMGQAQLDSEDHCNDRMIGTGPFVFTDSIDDDGDWALNDRLTVRRNEDYWYDGYPLLEEIRFQPLADSGQRINGVLGGQVDLVQYAGDRDVLEFKEDQENLGITVTETLNHAEVNYVMFNNSVPPFNNKNARLALAHGADREAISKIVNGGEALIANTPFAPGEIGYLEDSGWPEYDPELAVEYLRKYEEETGEKLSFTMSSTADPGIITLTQLLQQQAKDLGVDIKLQAVEQAKLVSDAISGNFQSTVFRNHPGGDPDGQHVWWTGAVNFARFVDPEMVELLNQGRAEPDWEKRREIYEAVSRRFADEVYNIWAWYARASIIAAEDVEGVAGVPPLDADGNPLTDHKQWTGLSTGHPVLALCRTDVSCPE